MEGFIYKITNKVNGKVYIGQTRYTIEFRWRQHQHTHDGTHLHNAISKYGIDNFIVEELEKCPIEVLNEREIFYIAKYNSFEDGYNLTIGGDGRRNLNLDSKYDEIKALYLSGFSSTKIGDLYKIDTGTVRKILKQLGVKIRSNKLNINQQEFKELVELYETGYSLKELARKYECSAPGLKEYLQRKGVDIKPKYSILKDKESQDAIISDYLDGKNTIAEICKKYKISFGTFKRILSLHGIDTNGKKNHFKMSDKECLECIKLRGEGWQIKDLANRYKVDRTTIYSMFKRYHVNYSDNIIVPRVPKP